MVLYSVAILQESPYATRVFADLGQSLTTSDIVD